jgi:ABC-type dipeptide/oligopeptide/nickel transport system permease component
VAQYLLKRVLAAVIAVWVTTIAVVLLIHLVPGDPVKIMFAQSQSTTPEQLEAVRHNLGLDRPIYEQYALYMSRILHGDFGRTIRGDQPILDLLLVRLPYTLELALASLAFATVLGLSLGFLAAQRRGTFVDTACMMLAIGGVSVPHFWLGQILIYLLAVKLSWFQVAGSDWRSLILPAVTLGLTNAAVVARLTRSTMIDIFNQDYVRTAWAKGLKARIVLARHVLRAGLVPIVTILGLQFAYTMGGAIIIENVFSWNGIGRLAIQAIFQRDYPLIQGFILTFACVVAAVSLLMDLLYVLLDPRIAYK